MKKILLLLPLTILMQNISAMQQRMQQRDLHTRYSKLPRNAQAKINRHGQKSETISFYSRGHTGISIKPLALACIALMLVQPAQAFHFYGQPFENAQDCFRAGPSHENGYYEECWKMQRHEHYSHEHYNRYPEYHGQPPAKETPSHDLFSIQEAEQKRIDREARQKQLVEDLYTIAFVAGII